MATDNVTFELKEPAPPDALLPRDHALTFWLGSVLVALVLLVAWFTWWLRHRTSNNSQTRRNLAYQKASDALARIAATDARAAAVQASLILRRYLALAANDPALFETHEEFIARNDALQFLTESTRAACATGFARLASLKYALTVPDAEVATVIAGAKELLETLHQGFQS